MSSWHDMDDFVYMELGCGCFVVVAAVLTLGIMIGVGASLLILR